MIVFSLSLMYRIFPVLPFWGKIGSPSEYDLDGTLIHLGLWTAPMNGVFGTGMTWWWDTSDPDQHSFQCPPRLWLGQSQPLVLFRRRVSCRHQAHHVIDHTLFDDRVV